MCKPVDEDLYIEYVKGFCQIPAGERVVQAYHRQFRVMVAQLVKKGARRGEAPAAQTLNRWAYKGAVSSLGPAKKLTLWAELYDKGELDFGTVSSKLQNVRYEAEDALRESLRNARLLLGRPGFIKACEQNPEKFTGFMKALSEINARLGIRPAEVGDLASVSEEAAIEIIGKLLEAHPRLAGAVGQLCGELRAANRGETAPGTD